VSKAGLSLRYIVEHGVLSFARQEAMGSPSQQAPKGSTSERLRSADKTGVEKVDRLVSLPTGHLMTDADLQEARFGVYVDLICLNRHID
jgi:hypothetical protein